MTAGNSIIGRGLATLAASGHTASTDADTLYADALAYTSNKAYPADATQAKRYAGIIAQAYPVAVTVGAVDAVEGGNVSGWYSYVMRDADGAYLAVYGADVNALTVERFTGNGARGVAHDAYRDNRRADSATGKRGAVERVAFMPKPTSKPDAVAAHVEAVRKHRARGKRNPFTVRNGAPVNQ